MEQPINQQHGLAVTQGIHYQPTLQGPVKLIKSGVVLRQIAVKMVS